LHWTIIPNKAVSDLSTLTAHAVEEYPTLTGPADYALFVEGQLLGIIEAKKSSVGAESVLEQAKRYDAVMFRANSGYEKPEEYLKAFEQFVNTHASQIEAIKILLSKPKRWNADVLEDLRDQLKQNGFSVEDLQRGYALVHNKPLVDIISMIKHASDFDIPLLKADECVECVINKIATKYPFSEEQLAWLAYIKAHLIENLAISTKAFELMPVFDRHGGLGKALKVFGDDFNPVLDELNEALAA